MASTGSTFSDVRSHTSWSSESRGAISCMTRTVSRMGTDTMTRSHSPASAAGVSAVDRPATSTSYPARIKIPAKIAPIFPVPPIIPAFTVSLLNNGLFDSHAKMPAAFKGASHDTIPDSEVHDRYRVSARGAQADGLGVVEDQADL